MRTAFIKQLTKEAETNDKLFLIIGDLGFSVVEEFEQKFPDRFLNAGIAEQNMVGIAAGLAMQGYNVYIYSIANFPTLRCMEQIRYDVAYHHLNVKIVSVGAGYAYGPLGASHHATEDLGMMRTIPDMVVCSPGDPAEAEAVTAFSASYDGPMYLRLGKAGEKRVHQQPLGRILPGNLIPVSEQGHQTAVIACGSILDAAKTQIADCHLPYDLWSIPFVKPINKEQVKMLCSQYPDGLIVMEEHQKSCGAGSALTEVVSDLYEEGSLAVFPKIRRLAINDEFVTIVGSQSFLREKAGLLL